MLRVAVLGKDKKRVSFYTAILRRTGNFQIVTRQPDVVFSIGGDGSFFYAERAYPGILKVLVKDSKVCRLCSSPKSFSTILSSLLNKKYKVGFLKKLGAFIHGKQFFRCINDFVIRNTRQYEAIRFSVFVGSKRVASSVIGDGIIISTSRGSGGYFSSVTEKSFSNGFGIAFNNPTLPIKPIFFNGSQGVSFALERGEAILSSDNNPKVVPLKKGNRVSFRSIKERGVLFEF